MMRPCPRVRPRGEFCCVVRYRRSRSAGPTCEVVRTYSTEDEPDGTLLKCCGNRREAVCPSCAEVYRGDAYPAEFRGNIFVADVAGNLFYRLVTQPDGVTFKAKRVDGDREFCAGRDVWFRPVNFANAPDGCLHVCDMYREAIEHPWSLPDDIHAALVRNNT